MKSFFSFLLFITFNTFSQTSYITIKGKVTDTENNEPVEKVNVFLKLSNQVNLLLVTDSTGTYKFNFFIDSPLTCTVSVGTDKYTKSKTFDELGFLANKDTGHFELLTRTLFEKNFNLKPVYGCGRIIPYIYFKTNQIVHCNDSLNKIDSVQYKTFNYAINDIVKYLTKNPTIIVELQGHASSKEKNSQYLSEYRAQLIKEVLSAKGINRKRIKIKGWGNKKLLIRDNVIKKAETPEKKAEFHIKNQRVLLRIISWDFEGDKK